MFWPVGCWGASCKVIPTGWSWIADPWIASLEPIEKLPMQQTHMITASENMPSRLLLDAGYERSKTKLTSSDYDSRASWSLIEEVLDVTWLLIDVLAD